MIPEYASEYERKTFLEPEIKIHSQYISCIKILLGAHAAVDDEVDGTIDNEEEVLDGSEAEHPAGVGGEHPQAPAQVGPLTNTGL